MKARPDSIPVTLAHMEIKIGIRQSNRELTLDVDASVEDITTQVNEAIS